MHDVCCGAFHYCFNHNSVDIGYGWVCFYSVVTNLCIIVYVLL